jgi:hypothetical protein
VRTFLAILHHSPACWLPRSQRAITVLAFVIGHGAILVAQSVEVVHASSPSTQTSPGQPNSPLGSSSGSDIPHPKAAIDEEAGFPASS